MQDWTKQMNETLTPVIEQAADAQVNQTIPENEPVNPRFEPNKLFDLQPGGERYVDTLSNYRQDPSNPYSPLNQQKVPATYGRFVAMYDRRQKMESTYLSILDLEDPAHREIEYNKFLFDNFGYDILEAKGHHVSSPSYWYKKFKQHDFSNPMNNDYIMESTLFEAETMFHEYTQYKHRNGFDMSVTESRIENLFGQKVTEEAFSDIRTFLNGEMSGDEDEYNTFMAMVKAGIASPHDQALYNDKGEMFAFINNDGVLHNVMTEDEYDKAGKPKGVMVMQEGGDLVLDDASGFRQVVGSFGQGLFRSLYDVGMFFGMMGGGAIDLLTWSTKEEKGFDNLMSVYQGMEGWANQFAFGGRALRVNMDGSKGWGDMNTWVGASRFVGQIGGTIGFAMVSGGAGLTGMFGKKLGLGAKTAHTAKASKGWFGRRITKAKSQKLIVQNIDDGVRLMGQSAKGVVTSSGQLADGAHAVVRRTMRDTLGDGLRNIQRTFGLRGVKDSSREALINSTSDNIMASLKVHIAKGTLTADIAQEVAEKAAKDALRAGFATRLIREGLADAALQTTAKMSTAQIAQIAKATTVKEIDTVVQQVLKTFYATSGNAFNMVDDVTIAAINSAVFAKRNAGEEAVKRAVRDAITTNLRNASNPALMSSVVNNTATEFASAFGQRSVVDSIMHSAKAVTASTLRVGGRMHGVYMGNPFGNLPAQSIQQMLWKRGAFATTYALRDGMTTYGMLRTLDVDHESALQRAQITFGINTAVAFAFTGGIDDSPIRDWAKVFGRPMYKSIPTAWAAGPVGKAGFGRLVLGDVLLDTVDNYVTMGTDAYFKNPEAEVTLDGWLSHLTDFWRDPQMLMSVGTISMLGARGSRRAHRMGFELPARGFDAVMKNYQSEAANIKNTPQQRNAAGAIVKDMQAQYTKFISEIETRRIKEGTFKEIDPNVKDASPEQIQQNLQIAEISGEAMIRTLEAIHDKVRNQDDSSMIKRIMVEQADHEKLRLLKNTYNETKLIIDSYSKSNFNLGQDIMRHGFANTFYNRMKVKLGSATEADVNLQRASKFFQEVLRIDKQYNGSEDQHRLMAQEIRRIMTNTEGLEELDLKLSDGDMKLFDSEIKVVKLEDADDTIKKMVNDHDKIAFPSGDYIVVDFNKNSLSLNNQTFKSQLAAYRTLAALYGELAGDSLPVIVQIDTGKEGHTFAVRMEYSDFEGAPGDYSLGMRSAIALDDARQVSLALQTIASGDAAQIRKAVFNLINITYAPKMVDGSWVRFKTYDGRSERVAPPKAVLNAVDKLIQDGYITMDRGIHVLRSIHPEATDYNAPSHYLVKYLSVIDVADQLESLPKTRPYDKKRTYLQGEFQRLSKELDQLSLDQVSKDRVSALRKSLQALAAAPMERTHRSSAQVEQAFRILDSIEASKLTAQEKIAVVDHVYTKMNAFDAGVTDIVERSASPQHLVRSLEAANYITKQTADVMLKDLTNHEVDFTNRVNQLTDTLSYKKSKANIEVDFLKHMLNNSKVVEEWQLTEYNYIVSRLADLKDATSLETIQQDIIKLSGSLIKNDSKFKAMREGVVQSKIDDALQTYKDVALDQLRHEKGYVDFELKTIKNRDASVEQRTKLLEDYYYDKYKAADMDTLADELKDHGIDSVVERMDLPARLTTVEDTVSELRKADAIKDFDSDDLRKFYTEALDKIDDYQHKGVKIIKNNDSRIVLDLNKLMPNKIYRLMVTMDSPTRLELLQSVNRLDKESNIGLVQTLKTYGVDGDIGGKMVSEWQNYQRILRQHRQLDSSPFITFESASANGWSGAKKILNDLGYADADFLVDGEVNIPGVHKFGTDVAIVEGRMRPDKIPFGMTTEEAPVTTYFNYAVDTETTGIYRFTPDTIINPRQLAAIGRNFNPNNRVRAVSTNLASTSSNFKLGKQASDSLAGSLDEIPQRGMAFDYSGEQLRILTLNKTIESIVANKGVMTVLPDSFDTTRQVDFGVWQMKELVVGAEGAQDKLKVLYGFDATKAQEYMASVIQAGGELDPSIIIPLHVTGPNPRSLTAYDSMRSIISSALERPGDSITDKVVNTEVKSLQEVLHTLVNYNDPTGRHKANDFEMLRQPIDTSELDLGGEINYSKNITIGEVIKKFENSPEGSPEKNLYHYAIAALKFSDEGFGKFAHLPLHVQEMLSIPDVRAVLEANLDKSPAQLVKLINSAILDFNSRNSLGDDEPLAQFNVGRLVSDNANPTKFEGGDNGSMVGTSVDRTYFDPNNATQRALTSNYVNELKPVFRNLKANESDVAALKGLVDDLKVEYGDVYKVTDEPLSKIYGMIRAVDVNKTESDDNTYIKANIPLKLAEEMTDVEWDAVKKQGIFDAATIEKFEEKRGIYNELTEDFKNPEGYAYTRPPVGDTILPGVEVTRQSLGSGSKLLDQAVTRNFLKDQSKYLKASRDQGMVKLRSLIQDRDAKNDYYSSTYKWIGEEILHRGDNPSAYMAIDENNRFYAMHRTGKIASMLATMKQDLGLKDSSTLVDTAYKMYYSTTGFKYASQLDQMFLIDSRTGKILDTGKSGAGSDEYSSLMKMIIAKQVDEDTVIYRVDKDSLQSSGPPVIRAIKPFEMVNNHLQKTDAYTKLETAAHAHFLNFMYNHRLTGDASDPDSVSNAFRNYINKPDEKLSVNDEHALRLGVTNYLFEAQGTLRSYQDIIRTQVAEHIGTGDWNRLNKLTSQIIRIGFGDIKDLDINKQEFDKETQSILSGLVKSVQTARENDAYMSSIRMPSKVQRLADVIVHGIDMDKLTSKVRLEYQTIKEQISYRTENRIDNSIDFTKKVGAYIDSLEDKKGAKATRINYMRTLNNLNKDISAYSRLLSAAQGDSTKIADLALQRQEIAKRISDTLDHKHFKTLGVDIEALRSAVFQKLYLEYISKSNDASVVKFFADDNLSFEEVYKWLKPENIAELSFLKGKSISDLAKVDVERTSLDIETVMDADGNQLPFSIGMIKYTTKFNKETGKYETVFKKDSAQRLILENKELSEKLNDEAVADFIAKQSADSKGWKDSFDRWKRRTKSRTSPAQLAKILNGLDEITTTNGKKFDIPELKKYLGDLYTKEHSHADTLNDFTGLMQLMSKSPTLKLEDMINNDLQLQKAYIEAFGKLPESHMEIDDARTSALLYTQMLNRGLTIQEEKGKMAKPILDIEEDFSVDLSEREIARISQDLGGYRFDSDTGEIHAIDGADLLGKVLSVMNDYTRNKDTNTAIKLFRTDVRDNIPTFYSRSVRNLLGQTRAVPYFKLLHLASEKLNTFPENKISVKNLAGDLKVGDRITKDMFLDIDNKYKSEVTGTITRIEDDGIYVRSLGKETTQIKTKKFFESLLGPSLLEYYNKFERFHSGEESGIELYGKVRSQNNLSLNQSMDLLLRQDVLNDPRFFEIYNKHANRLSGDKDLGDMTLDFQRYDTLSEEAIDVTNLKNQFFDAFGLEKNDPDLYQSMALKQFNSVVNPLNKIADTLGLTGSRTFNNIKSPLNENINAGKIPEEKQYHVSKTILHRAILDFDKDMSYTTIRKGVKVGEYNYNLATTSTNTSMKSYSDIVNRIDGGTEVRTTPKPGDIIMSRATVERMYGREKAEVISRNDGEAFLNLIRHPSDRPHSLNVFRIIVADTGIPADDRVSVVMNATAIRMLGGDFDGDHVVTIGDNNKNFGGLLKSINQSQFQTAERFDNFLNTTLNSEGVRGQTVKIQEELGTLNKALTSLKHGDTSPLRNLHEIAGNKSYIEALTKKIYGVDFDQVERFDLETESKYFTRHPNDYDLDKLIESLSTTEDATLKGTPLYKETAESLVSILWVLNAGKYRGVHGESGATKFMTPRLNTEAVRTDYRNLRGLQQVLMGAIGPEADSMTGVSQLRSIEHLKDSHIMRNPLAEMGQRGLQIDDSMELNFVSAFDSADETFRMGVIQDLKQSIDVYYKEVMDSATDVKMNEFNLKSNASSKGEDVLIEARQVFELIDMLRRLDTTNNEAFKKVLNEVDTDGLLTEVFTAHDLRTALKETYADVFESRSEELFTQRSASSFRKHIENDIINDLLNEYEVTTNPYKNTAVSFGEENMSKKVRVLFQGDWDLRDNSMVLGEQMYQKLKYHEVRDARVNTLDPDIKVGKVYTEGTPISLDGRVTAPITGRLVRFSDGVAYFHRTDSLGKDIKVGTPQSTINKATLAGVFPFKVKEGKVDAIMHISNLESMKKFNPDFLSRLLGQELSEKIDIDYSPKDGEVRTIKTDKGIVYEMDLMILEGFMHSKNKNDNLAPSKFGGKQEGGKIDLLTMMSNLTSQTNPILFGKQSLSKSDADYMFTQKLIPFKEYLDSTNPHLLNRNMVRDVRSIRLQIALSLLKDKALDNVLGGASLKESIDALDKTSLAALLSEADAVERKIKQEANIKDLAELITPELREKMGYDDGFLERLLSNELADLTWSKMLGGISDARDIESKRRTPLGTEVNTVYGRGIGQVSEDASIINNTRDLSRSSLTWKDLYSFLYKDTEDTFQKFLPGGNDLDSFALKKWIPVGKGYQSGFEGKFNNFNEDDRLPVEHRKNPKSNSVQRLTTTGGVGAGRKSGTELLHPYAFQRRPGASYQRTMAEVLKDTQGIRSKETADLGNPIKNTEITAEGQLRFITQALTRSAEENRSLTDGKRKYKMPLGALDMNFNKRQQHDFQTRGTNMYSQFQIDEDGIHYGVKQQPYSVRPDDVSDLAKQQRGAITMRSLEEQASQKADPGDEINRIYNDRFTKDFKGISQRITSADVNRVFSKFTADQKEAMRVTPVDASEFLAEFKKVQAEFRQIFAKTNMDTEGVETLMPTDQTVSTRKTVTPDFVEGFNLNDQFKRDLLLLTASGLKEDTTLAQNVGRVVNKLGTAHNRIASQLSVDLVAFNKLLRSDYNKSGFFNYIRNMHVLTLIHDTKQPHAELLRRVAPDGMSDPKDIVIALEAQVETFKNLNGHLTKQWDQIATKIFRTTTEVFDTPMEARYAIMYPVKTKMLNKETKQGMFVSTVNAFFNPKKYSLLQDGLTQRITIDDPVEALTSVIQEVSKMGAIREFSEGIRDLGLVNNVKVVELTQQYMKMYMEEGTTVYSKKAKDAVAALFEDPHASKYLNESRQSILQGIGKLDEKSQGMAIMGRVKEAMTDAKTKAFRSLKESFGTHDPKMKALLREMPAYRDLIKMYDSTDSPIIRNQIMDLINIQKLEQEIIGFGLSTKKEGAPDFSTFLKNSIGDEVITDKYLRLIDYDKDNGIRMKPLTESDTSYVKDLFAYRNGERADFELQLLSRGLNGEIYSGNRSLANHMDKYFFTHKIKGKAHDAVRTAGLFFNKFVMGNPLRLPERVFGRFVMFDLALTSMQNPKTLFYFPQSLKEIGQLFKTNGKVMSEDLKDYYAQKGIAPDSSRMRDYLGRTERVKSLPGKMGDVQDFVLESTEYMSDATRYASFLANKRGFEAGKNAYGPAYKKKAMIDALETPGQKAWEVTKQSLPTVGDLPLLSRKVAPYMVFTSFGWGLTRTTLDYISSARRVIEDAVVRGDTSGVYRNLLVPGMGVAGMYLFSSVMLSLIGELFDVDDETVDQWKEDQNFIDPYGSFVAGTPVTRNTWNPIQMMKNDWIKPITEGYKGYDKYSDDDDGMHYAMLGLLNHQILSKMNPLIKTPVETITQHDLFGSLPIDTKNQYSMMDNIRRKLSGIVLGTSAGNSLINNLNLYEYQDAPWVEKYINSMAMAIGDEFGNSRAYKREVKDFYKARGLIYNYIYAEDKDASDSESVDLANSNIADQYSSSDYDSDAATRIARTIRQAMNQQLDMSVIHKLIYDELENGTPLSSIRTALNRNSINRLLTRVENLEEFKSLMSDSDWKVIQSALAFEDNNFPDIADLLPYPSNDYRRSFNWNIPYNSHSYMPYPNRFNRTIRKPYRNDYKHWSEEVQSNMGVDDPQYVQPGIDKNMGIPQKGWWE